MKTFSKPISIWAELVIYMSWMINSPSMPHWLLPIQGSSQPVWGTGYLTRRFFLVDASKNLIVSPLNLIVSPLNLIVSPQHLIVFPSKIDCSPTWVDCFTKHLDCFPAWLNSFPTKHQKSIIEIDVLFNIAIISFSILMNPHLSIHFW